MGMPNTRNKVLIAGILSEIILAVRRLAGKDRFVLIYRRGIRWKLDLAEGIDLSIYLFGELEPGTFRLYQRLLSGKKGAVILDIGANIGAHSLLLARIVGKADGMVYAVEPTSWAFEKLQDQLALNPKLEQYIRPFRAFFSVPGSRVPTEIYSSWPLTGESQVHPVHRGKLMSAAEATTTTLDDFVQTNNISRIDLIKLDVDGHEWEVLQGARASLARFKPDILMEWAPYLMEAKGLSEQTFLDLFSDLGYELYEVQSGTKVPLNAVTKVLQAPAGGSVNIFWRSTADGLQGSLPPFPF